MPEQKWNTPREAYWGGFEDGYDVGESRGYESAIPAIVLMFAAGFVIGVVVI